MYCLGPILPSGSNTQERAQAVLKFNNRCLSVGCLVASPNFNEFNYNVSDKERRPVNTIQDEVFLRRISSPLILCSLIFLFDFALSESTWRTVRSQVRHCTCQTPEISVLQYYCSAVSSILIHFDTLM